MSDSNPINLTPTGPPETILPRTSAEFRHVVERAFDSADVRRSLADVVAAHPRECLGWATLAEMTDDVVSRYAYFRVGYHRGLDTLRANGWRGSGYVRWEHEGNRGFLRCLLGLAESALTIGEIDEHERCRLFLLQLDPLGVPESI